jgi:hypothetical protein
MKKKFNNVEINEILKLYVNEFKSVGEIKDLFGCGVKPIYRILKENDIKIPKDSAYNPKYWIERGMSVEDANQKINEIRPTNIEYWINKGYSKEVAEKKLDQQRLLKKSSFIDKFGVIEGNLKWEKRKIELSKRAKTNLKSSKEYWLKRGFFNETIINKKISESQRKFSKQICVNKLGKKNGIKKWEERQKKWQKTMSNKENINEINKKKDCRSVFYYKRKYGDNWLDFLIEKRTYTNENKIYIKKCLNSKTYDDMLNYIVDNYEYIDYYNFRNRIAIPILSEYYNVKHDKFKNDLIKKFGFFGNSMFGYKKQYNGILFSSVGEYYIGKYLIDNNVFFEYNKKYHDNVNFRYDFYIPILDLYIEYAGLLFHGLKENKIINSYGIKIKNKILYCEKHNLNLFVSIDYLSIIDKIKNSVYEKEN